MNELHLKEVLPVSQEMLDGIEQPTIDARKLHAALKVGRDFTTWVKGRIEEYKFNENKDFIVFTEMGENPRGGRPTKEYRLSLDMGKELAMVENNEEGRRVRRYFIECEKALRVKAGSAQGKYSLEDKIAAAAAVLRPAGIEGNQLSLALDNLHRRELGYSALEATGTELVAPTQDHLLTPTQLGKQMTPPLSAQKVNLLLTYNEFQNNVNGTWIPTDKGRVAGAIFMDAGKHHNSGTPVRQLRWPRTILAELKI